MTTIDWCPPDPDGYIFVKWGRLTASIAPAGAGWFEWCITGAGFGVVAGDTRSVKEAKERAEELLLAEAQK
jgi:hypothetical protein